MTAPEAILWSAAKAAAVGLAAGWTLSRGVPRSGRTVAVLAVLAVLPALLPGYAYRPESLRWVNERWKTDLLHTGLCFGRFLPWATLVAWLVGELDFRQFEDAWRQTRPRRSWSAHFFGAVLMKTTARMGRVAGGAAAAVLTFTESEIAGLLQARCWPEWTLRKLAGGVPPADLLAKLWPVPAVVVLAIAAVSGHRSGPQVRGDREPGGGRRLTVAAGLALAVCGGLPLLRITADIPGGAAALLRQPAFGRELAVTVGFAGVAATAAAWMACRRPVVAWLGLLGLLGPLMTAVGVQAVLAGVGGGPLLGTPALHLAALLLVVAPFGLLLFAGVRRLDDRAALVARQLGRHPDAAVRRRAARAVWLRTHAPLAGAWGLLFLIAFWDLLVAATLHAPGWSTVPGRLYNLAHYGQSDALAAMLVVATAVSVTVAAMPLAVNWWRKVNRT